jgi:hypothetical protein
MIDASPRYPFRILHMANTNTVRSTFITIKSQSPTVPNGLEGKEGGRPARRVWGMVAVINNKGPDTIREIVSRFWTKGRDPVGGIQI